MAFWNKKAETTPKPSVEQQTQNAIGIAAYVIDVQLDRVTKMPSFGELVVCPFVRGYLMGAFTAAMQVYKVPGYQDDMKMLAFLVDGHVYMMGEKSGHAYAMASLQCRGDRNYDFGNRVGGTELIDFLNDEVPVPTQLFNYCKGI